MARTGDRVTERHSDRIALIAQLVERALGKGEVMGPNPIGGSRHQDIRGRKEKENGEAEVRAE